LGLPTALGDHIITREEVEACCSLRPMARSRDDLPPHGRGPAVIGVDWGGGTAARTVVCIGYMRSDNIFEVCYLETFAANEEPNYLINQVAQRCRQFGVQFIAADGGGAGIHLNRMLARELACEIYGIFYTASSQQPRQNGVLWDWSVPRTATIGHVFSRIKLRRILFPRIEDCGSLLEEFWCEIAEYDEYSRTIKYTHAATQHDDTLHATNYALLLGRRSLGNDETILGGPCVCGEPLWDFGA
jgi:hypothetical protein